MSEFLRALHAQNPPRKGRRWLYVPYDQLSDVGGPLSEQPASELGIVMLENPGKASRRPYHKQKLALVRARPAA
jgi:deoxyribodipyrimidine photolyase-related protein